MRCASWPGRLAAIVSALVLAGGPARAADAPAYPPFGLDLAARDAATKPGDDFFRYANGRYVDALVISADEVAASRRANMSRDVDDRLHALLEDAARDVPEQPADWRGKAGAFYAAYLDTARIERLGLRPLAPELDAIRAARDLRALAALMGRANADFYPSAFLVTVDVDLKTAGRYAAYVGQSGLGLPDIDYYSQPQFAAQREAYRAYAARLLGLAKWPKADASADAILAFETRIARASWSKARQRDMVAEYHPVTAAGLARLAPAFPWREFLRATGLGPRVQLVANEDSALPAIAEAVKRTPLATLKAWMAFRTIDAAAADLPAAFADARFELRDHVLAGQAEPAPRWKRGLRAVGGGDCLLEPETCFGTLRWAVGRLYAERWFPADTKAKMTTLAGDLKTAFRHRIDKLSWMGPATRAEALRKLDAVTIKVGYPDTWRDYGGVRIRRDDLVGDVRATAAADWAFVVGRAEGPVDRGDWFMTPQTNDAYSGSLLDIVFPAGILQPPIFDAAADPAVNYGAAGGIIGHELTHQFDDQGRTVDATGVLRDWWTADDAAAFKARAATLGAQFATYEPLPGVHINPELTMGENLADLGGLSIALDAYHESLAGRPAPVLDGLSGDQRVFLGWAQAWAGKLRPEAIRKQAASDPHSFRNFRVNGPMRNIDGWYEAFGVKEGDALWLAPEKRARVW